MVLAAASVRVRPAADGDSAPELVEPYHFYMETLMRSRYTKGRGARARPGGLTAGAPIMRVRLVSHAGLVIVVLVSAGRVVAACEREDPLCEGSL